MMHCFERTITLPGEVAADTETRKPGAGKVLRQRFYANPSGEVLQALWLGVLKPSGFTKVSSTMNVDSEEVGAPPERVFAWMGTHPVFLTLPQAASNSPTLPSVRERMFWLYHLRDLCGWECPGIPLTGRLKDMEPFFRQQWLKSKGKEKEASRTGEEDPESFRLKRWVLKEAGTHEGKNKVFLNSEEVIEILNKKESLRVPTAPLSLEGHSYDISLQVDQIVQEEVDMQMVDGRANHVRVHAIVMDYLNPQIFVNEPGLLLQLGRLKKEEGCIQTNFYKCSQDAARNSSFANATVLSEEDALMQSQDFFNLPFVQEKTEEERKGGMATATKILRTLEAAIVTAVLAVRDYYSQFFTAASGPDKASLHYHIWFFDFLIDRTTKEPKLIDVHDNYHGHGPLFKNNRTATSNGKEDRELSDFWSYTHLLFWKGLFKTFGMGPLSGGTDGKGAQEEADPCAYKLRSRMETLRKSLSLSLSASSDEEGKGQGETPEAIPQAAIEYEVRIRRNQGSSIRPVWPPDDVAGREWVAAFDAAAQPPQKFSAYLSAIKGAMGMTEKSGRDGGERRVRGSLEWPLAGEGRQSELEETVGGRKGTGTSLKERLVRDHVSAELRRWIDEKRKAGGLEAFLVEKEKEAQVFIGQRKAEFETSTEEETQQAESSGGNALKDEL